MARKFWPTLKDPSKRKTVNWVNGKNVFEFNNNVTKAIWNPETKAYANRKRREAARFK